MNTGHLTDCVKTMYVEFEAVAGTSTLTTDVVDMSGYDAVRFIALTGDATSGTVLTLTSLSNTANSASGGTSEAVATYTSTSSTDADNKLLITDVVRPAGRYVYATLARATQNCVVNGIICELYRARSLPITQDSVVLAHTEAVKAGAA